jgi:hypothetical protein
VSGPVSVTGTAPRGSSVEVAPTLVVQTSTGLRDTVVGLPVPLDGHPHTIDDAPDLAGSQLVAVRLAVTGGPGTATGTSAVPVDVSVPSAATAPSTSRDWHVTLLDGQDGAASAAATTVAPSAAGTTTVSTTVQLDLARFEYVGADLVASTFTPPRELPVAVSQQLADALGTSAGGELTATVDLVDVPLRVTAVLPTVPSAPDRVAVLADADLLSRVLIGEGRLEPVVDGWWVDDPRPGTVRALRALDLGDVSTEASIVDELRRGPLQATVTAVLVLLVGAAGVMLLAGTALVVAADRPARSAEVARLRALGSTRRSASRIVLAELGLVLGTLVAIGIAVGAGLAAAVGPALVLSDTGGRPVPPATFAWPWAGEGALAAALVAGVLVVAGVATAVVVSRSGAEQLRAADA